MTTRLTVDEKRTPAQALMLANMIARQRERLEGWSVELVDDFPPLTSIKTRTVTGMFSWSLSVEKRRLLKRQHATDIGGGWCTPGDVARDYLAIKHEGRRLRMTTRQWRENVQGKIAPPLYCSPQELSDAVYIDLTSAYWNIVRAVGWDVNYCPLRFLSAQSDVDDFPVPENKMARNCLVSVGLPGTMRVWTGERLTFQKKPNRFINLMLYRLVCDVLNGVAYDAIEAGAIYVYTDGFIVARERADAVFSAVERWGLSAIVKYEGTCSVRGPAAYKFPERETKAYKRCRLVEKRKVYGGENDWLRPRFALFADRSNIRTKENV